MQTMVVFTDKGFIDDCTSSNQMITFCGFGSHHQNGIAERKIKDITLGGRTLLLHAKRMFPEYISVLSVLAASDPLLYFGEKDGRKMI